MSTVEVLGAVLMPVREIEVVHQGFVLLLRVFIVHLICFEVFVGVNLLVLLDGIHDILL
jgi:hypothetical protein